MADHVVVWARLAGAAGVMVIELAAVGGGHQAAVLLGDPARLR